MSNWFINFRKKYILPWRWKKTVEKEISEFRYPEEAATYAKMKELHEEYLKAEKLEKNTELQIVKAKIELLNWFIGK